MATGDTLYQFILDYHFPNCKLKLTSIICSLQVNYVLALAILVVHLIMCCTGYVDINVEAMGALSNVYHLDNCSQDNSLYSYLNNGALEDRADQCSFSNHCYHNSRKRAILQGSTTDKPCKYTHIYIICYYS